jgi:hypothetical protein
VQLRLFEFIEKLHAPYVEFSKNLFITQASSSQIIKVVSIPVTQIDAGVGVQPQFRTKVKTSCSTFHAKNYLGFQQKFPLKSLLDLIRHSKSCKTGN